ncbi:MAG: FlgD immunoglobulin-like domain containing protein [Armatimonadota bacterium]|nr:FlgD immunoglobulin-like domain containing protein [Armatimonadota bacterium]
MQASVTIELGDYRALALDFVQKKFGLSRPQARSVMHRYEQMHGDRIINRLELPEGAVLDFVTVDGAAADPDSAVTYDGSGVLRAAHPALFGEWIRDVLESAPPQERKHIQENIRQALERGWFIDGLTAQQRENLLKSREPGEGPVMRPQATQNVRILVVLTNFPHWNDESPAQGRYDTPVSGGRQHPVSEGFIHTPGGPLNTSDWDSDGLSNPTWDASGVNPAGGTNAAVTNHPRIEYTVNGERGTSVDLKEAWFTHLFDRDNPMSVVNYYHANSHGQIAIDGNRSDIVGPLESHHQLDRLPWPETNRFSIQPGTPVIRDIESGPNYLGVPGLRGLSADSGTEAIVTLGYTGRISISGVQEWDADNAQWNDVAIESRQTDAYEPRRYIAVTEGFDDNAQLRAFIGGVQVQFLADVGFSLDTDDPQGSGASLLTSADVMGSAPANRLLSMCYYTHDHIARGGALGSRPYQLRHLVNTSGRVDDVGGTVDSSRWHYPRPKPLDHDPQDHSSPNMGFFESPSSNGGHTYAAWTADTRDVLQDEGFAIDVYDQIIYLYPSDSAGGIDAGGTSGPWSGTHVFIPNSAVVLPSDAGLYLTAHELGHAIAGLPDLYDWDFYRNLAGASPPHFVSNMMGPYSVMAAGRRMDAFSKILAGWVTPIAVTEDIVDAEVPEIEGTLEDPVVYKLPGRPFYIANDIPPEEWQEFYLVENRNRTGQNYFGDISPRGLYIYHVDTRFGQYGESTPLVIVEQADGLFELESNPVGNWGDIEGDPFPGSTDNRNFTQFTEPDSFSHGWLSGIGLNQVRPQTEIPPGLPPGSLQPGTATDGFSRVANISTPGRTMTADLWVVPREVIVTSVPIPDKPASVLQGTEDFLMMHLHLNNDSEVPNLSRGDVELATIRIDEIGSSQDELDVDRISLFDDTDGDGQFDVGMDTRIATASLQNQAGYFSNLNYRIPLDEERDLFITFDISSTADALTGVSLGAGMATFDYIRPEIPGAVQRRERQEITDSNDGLGAYRFPINSQLVDIEEDPDTLTVTPISRAPIEEPPEESGLKAIEPGQEDTPILSLDLEVDQDRAAVTRIKVDETGTMNAVSDITSTKLYLDANSDGQVDGGDTLLDETTFARVGDIERASYDIQSTPVVVVEGSPKSVLMTVTLSANAPLEEPPLTVQLTLEDTSYITLRQSEDIVSDENFPMSSEAVGTPVPNDPPPPPTNLAATQEDDGSILLTWELSEDDPAVGGEADVTTYNIYRATDPSTLPDAEPADAYASVEDGVTEYADLNAPLDVDLYYMMRAYDGVQEGDDSAIVGPVQAVDLIPPELSEFDPEQGEDGVARDTTIAFTITDNASGVDQDSLVFMVDDTDVTEAEETDITGSAQQLRVEYDPAEDYDYLQTVQVQVRVADLAGNINPGADQFVSYSFTTEGPPTFWIAGVVTDQNGEPEEGVKVQAGQLFDMTDDQGQYQVTGLAAGTYQVRPSKDGRSFMPEMQQVTVGPSQVAINFTSAPGYDISGTVEDPDGNGLPGVTVSDGQHSDITSQDGSWAIENVPADTYQVTPQLVGYVFTPPTVGVTVGPDEGDATGITFVGEVKTFDVTGAIRTSAGDRLAGIKVDALQDGTVVASATSGANGSYSIVGLTPGNYIVKPDDDRYAFQPEQRELDLATDLSDVDFAAASLYTMPLGAGLSFVSVPVEPLNPDVQAAFGDDVQVARWDPQDSPPYLTAPSNDPLMRLGVGRGFWVNSPDQRTASVAGEVYPSDEGLVVNVAGGWNMAGNPYDRNLPWERLVIPEGSPASAYGFIYDSAAGTYRLVSTAAGLGALTSVPKNAGFWLRAGAATQVTINAPGAAPASAEVVERAARKPSEDAWIVPVVARAGGVMDACTYAGVLPQASGDPAAYEIDNPPAIGPFVDVYFLDEGGRRHAVDVRPAAAAGQSWQFEVATDLAGVEVEVLLPDLSEVPADKTVTLVDEAAGKRIYARTMTAYSYDSGEGGSRRFRLEIADRDDAGLMITGATASGGAGAVTVSYTLSAQAQVGIEVLNIAGRRVATLASGEPQAAGVQSVAWSGRSATGTLCPAGRYLVRISARADSGQQVQALVPLSLER